MIEGSKLGRRGGCTVPFGLMLAALASLLALLLA